MPETEAEREAARIVREVIQQAGKDGIAIHDFYSHALLEGFSHGQIEPPLRHEINALRVTLGDTAKRYVWVPVSGNVDS